MDNSNHNQPPPNIFVHAPTSEHLQVESSESATRRSRTRSGGSTHSKSSSKSYSRSRPISGAISQSSSLERDFMEHYDPNKSYSISHSSQIQDTTANRASHNSWVFKRLNQVGSRSPELSSHSVLSVAKKDEDFEALKEGLSFALGSTSGGANWFPVNHDKKSDQQSSQHMSPSVSPHHGAADLTNEIPMLDLRPIEYEDSLGHSLYTTNSQVSRTPFSDQEATSNNVYLNADALESGKLSLKISNQNEGSSPANFITKISNRIAGTGYEANTDNLASKKRLSDISTDKSENRDNLLTPVSKPVFDDHRNISNENLLHPGSTNVSIAPGGNGSVVSSMPNSATQGLGLYLQNKSKSSSERADNSERNTAPGSRNPSILRQFASKSSSSRPSSHHFKYKGQKKSMYLFGNSLNFFSPQSKVRQLCYKVVSHAWLNFALLVLLLVQTGLLAYRQWDPIRLHGYYYEGYNWADYALILINFIYTIEVIGKIITYGFLNDHVMFEELGLPYPESQFNIFHYNPLNIQSLISMLGIYRWNPPATSSRFNSNRKSHIVASDQESSSSDDHVEINLQEEDISMDPNSKANKGQYDHSYDYNSQDNSYSQRLLLHSQSFDHTIEDTNLKDVPISNEQKLKSKNTLLKSKTSSDIDQLNLKRAYARNSWHRIDFVSTVCFWVSLLLSIEHYDAENHIMLFRALSCLRILRLCNLTTGTSTILMSCKAAIPKLIDISMFIGFFWLAFGIIGVQSFKASLTRHCVWTNPNDPTDTYVSGQYCGSYMGLNGTVQPYLYSDGTPSLSIKGFRCPMYSQCVTGDNPYGGTVNFDNILQSLEMVFVIMSANTFTDIMYYTMDTDTMASCLFFIAGIFILTVWLMNVFIAAIVTSFNSKREQDEIEESKGGVWRYLFPPSDGTTFNEKIDKAKKQNVFLKYYYSVDFIFVLLIIADLFAQCFRNYRMSDDEKHALYRIEAAFTCTFLAEIVLRFLFHIPNLRLFFASRRNMFDLFLATITSIIILNPVKQALGHAYYWLTVFQLMRFYRVVVFSKLTRNLWIKIMKNFRAIFDLALFYFILLSLVSIIMARFFEGVVPEDEISSESFPMHTLPNSFIALYVITSTENWTEVLYAVQEYGHTPSSRAFGAILLISWFILSNSVILNIFIAVIAHALEVSEEGKRRKQLLQFIDNMTSNLSTMDTGSGLLTRFKRKVFKTKAKKDELESAVVNLLLAGKGVKDFLDDEELSEDEVDVKELPVSKWKRTYLVNYYRLKNYFKNPFYSKDDVKKKVSLDNFDPSNFARTILVERNALIAKQNTFLQENPRFNYVFYVLTPQHRVRRFCQRIVSSSYGDRVDGVEPYKRSSEIFSIIMFLATIALVVTACYLTPLYRKRQVELYGNFNWAFWLEVAFNVLFTSEFLIKIFADGLMFTPNAYLRSSWNSIDLCVLISLWVELIAFLRDDGNLARLVRGLKALRALRLLTISETAKANFQNTLISGFGKILNAAFISLCLLFPFSIWGLNIFEGRLGYCLDGSSPLGTCYNEYSNQVFNWNIVSPNVYTHPQLQFNNFGTAFATLFEIVSLEGWVDLLQNLINSTGVGTVPQMDSSPINGAFLVFFNFVSTIFILTLFISVIISNYARTTGRAYMTRDQICWYQVKKILLQAKPSKRKNTDNMSSLRRFCYQMTIERNKYWLMVLNFTLFLHVIALLAECYPTTDGLDLFRSIAYMAVSVVFTVHLHMLCVAQGLRTFLGNNWNIFSTVVCIGAIVSTFIGFFLPYGSAFININKLFLVGILTFVIPRSNRLSQLLRFASAGLPSFLSLAFTWGVGFLVFAIALNQIFGLTKIGPNGTGNINLRSVPKALIVLFKCSFGEGWNYVMADYTIDTPFCTASSSIDESDCGNKQYAYVLFIAWNILSMYIFVNMFVSLILDSFSYVNYKSGYGNLIDRDEIRKYKRSWQKFDPDGTGYIKPIDLPKFLHSLDGELSFHFYSGVLEIPVLCDRWFTRNNIHDPYDVTPNYKAIQETLDSMDIPKIRERRKEYERFIEEALFTMELNNDPGISFTRILLQLPLYTSFEAGQCLNLIDFLERRLLMQRVDKQLQTKRVYETIAAYACRWKYKQNQKLGIRDTNIEYGASLKRNSYLTNENYNPNADKASETGSYVFDRPSSFRSADDEFNDEDNDGDGDGDREDDENDNEAYEYEYDEEGDRDNKENTSHGTYIPKSPIRIYKTKKAKQGPSIFIEVSKSLGTGVSPQPSPTSPVDHLSPFYTKEEAAAHSTSHDVSFVDLSTVGEVLETSSWGEALHHVGSRDSPKSDKSKKSR